MAMGVYLDIDASELMDLIDRLRHNLTPERFNQVMYGIFSRTGGHVRRILQSDLPKEYHVKAREVGQAVKRAKVSGTSCIIPVIGPRKNIGSGFSASGGAHGWNSLRRKYRVRSRIVRSNVSVLPPVMSSYGGMPPFRNLGSRLGGLTFTRAGKGRFPIMKVSGIAIPQMPANRSEADVQADIMAYMKERLEHEISRLICG